MGAALLILKAQVAPEHNLSTSKLLSCLKKKRSRKWGMSAWREVNPALRLESWEGEVGYIQTQAYRPPSSLT